MPELTDKDLKKEEYAAKKKEINKDFESILSKIEKRKQYYEERYSKSLNLAKKDFAYARGEQWDEETLNQMKDEEGNLVRPAITQNLIKGHLAYLRGNQAQTRYYFKVLPADGIPVDELVKYAGQKITYNDLALKLTEELKKIENENDGEYELDDCFHEAIAGAGHSTLEVITKEDESVFPRIKKTVFEHRRYDQSFADPDHRKYDLSDSKDHIKISEITREDLIALIPDKEDVIKELSRYEEDLASKEDKSDGELTYNEESQQISNDNKDNSNLFLVEYYDYEWIKEYLLIIPNSGEEPYKFSQEEHAEIKKTMEEQSAQDPAFEYLIVPLKRKCWYVSSYCSGVVLQREKYVVNDVPLTRLPFAEYACDRLNSVDEIHLRDLSVTRELISTQDIHNKAISQLISHLSSSMHSGIVAEENVLIDEDNWENFGASAGFIGYIKQGSMGRWQQITPTPISDGHAVLSKLADTIMPLISGVNPNLTATSSKNESGKAKALQIRQGQTTTNYIFDNFRRTKHVLCSILLEHICAIQGLDYKNLKVVIDDSAESPTARYANWQETKEVLESTGGLQTPYADLVVDMMNINDRDAWKNRWKETNEFAQWKAQQEAEAKAMQEHDNPKNKALAEQAAIADAQAELGQNIDINA